MLPDLQELLSIARGEIEPKNGVTGVSGVTGVARYASKSPELRQLRQLRVKNAELEKDVFGGVADGVAPLVPAPLFDPEALQAEADRRNRKAIAAGLTDRFCACRNLATVAIFDPSPMRGNTRWLCRGCFEPGFEMRRGWR